MGKRRCICEICTCGRHRCPHRPNVTIGRGDRPCLLSEYNTTYRAHPIVPRESCKPPAVAIKGDGPLEDRTTHRVDYIPHPIERPQFHVPDQYSRPAGDHDMMTSYHKDYTEKQGAPAKAIKQLGMRHVPGKFEGEPTYKTDYRKWDMAGRPNRFGDVSTWNPPQQPFEGQSTFTRDYQRYNQAPRTTMKPNEAAKMSDAPFDGNTGYNAAYIKHPLQAKFVKEKDTYRPSGVRFDGLSTFKRDYQGAYAPKTDSCKPDAQAFQSQAPLEDMTTFKNDYRKWDADRPFVRDPEQYKKPVGDMDMNTTHNLAFKEYPLQRAFAKRPHSANVMRAGTFDGTTNYSTDFRPWDLGQRSRPVMKPDYQPNNAPFEGMSTQKSHYIPHPINPNQSCKPSNDFVQSQGPFDDNTMYRMDYTPKASEPCPAAVIDTTRSTYKFVELDTRGHKLYQPVFESVTALNGYERGTPQVRMQTLVA
ncbi:stabilizer of axonemal microtubules 2-like [Haliotis rufescens]|uniref:stabilizer of axonemal microtubules 2-like n=1 Tax=Haliotis rufescens TaxID=6454 RepID=UPI001EB06F2E|nr:stabilizer of axonemal microtubules 2-like [Haliotis rufescens]